MLSVIIPANDEAGWIGACLGALLASDPLPGEAGGAAGGGAAEIVVSANACTDATVAIAEGFAARAAARGWRLVVLDRREGGKPGALDAGDAAAAGEMRVYLDADVTVSPGLLPALAAALDRPGPAWASGRLTVAPAATWVTRAYARVWARVPFMTDCVPGAGLFAVNAAGRARWGRFPAIISDDTYVRLLFAPGERIGLPEPYLWPMVEGWRALVRVRRRQDAGVAEIARRFPELMRNEDKPRFGLARLLGILLTDPAGFAVYFGVALAVRLPAREAGWSRGR
jgi:glycosyltransferase involved in cell wall biosynthesis